MTDNILNKFRVREIVKKKGLMLTSDSMNMLDKGIVKKIETILDCGKLLLGDENRNVITKNVLKTCLDL